MRPFLLSLACTLLVLPFGCIQADQETTLFPDGSGKIVMEVGIKKTMMKVAEEMAKQNGLQPGRGGVDDFFAEFEAPEKIRKNTEGVVGWKSGRRREDGDWIRASFTAYFDDVNKLRIYSSQAAPNEERKLSAAWRLTRLKNGANALTLTSDVRRSFDEMSGKKGGQPGSEELAKAMVEMMKPIFQDFKVTLRVTVPGPIRESTGFMESSGRSAAFLMEGGMLIAAASNPDGPEARRLQAVADAGNSRVVWTDVSLSSAEIEDWKNELAGAKQDWARRTGIKSGTPTPPAAEPEVPLSDDEVEAGFIKAKVKVARTHLEAGRKEKAREILQGVLRDFPKHALTKEARELLATIP